MLTIVNTYTQRDARIMRESLENILWKVYRDESPNGSGNDCIPAEINRNDACIRQAQEIIDALAKGNGVCYEADKGGS